MGELRTTSSLSVLSKSDRLIWKLTLVLVVKYLEVLKVKINQKGEFSINGMNKTWQCASLDKEDTQGCMQS